MINLFFSYSHKDEALRDELDKHLSILKRQNVIAAWHDRRINAGTEIDAEINNNLKKADVILLLVSSDFLASDYCYEKEMKFAIEQHEAKKAVVIPVILRPCDWKNAPFGKIMGVPTDGIPVTKFPNYDEAFLQITDAIRKVAADNTANGKAPSKDTTPKAGTPFQARSSNLRIAKRFSDQEKDTFLDTAFEYISNYFEGSLEELSLRNPEVTYNFKRLDSQTFSATIYINQEARTQCMVFYGAGNTFSKYSISYSNTISAHRNSMNDGLSMEEDESMLYLKPSMNMGHNRMDERLTHEGAAEYFWGKLIEPIQSRR